jgi:hypothetical protein
MIRLLSLLHTICKERRHASELRHAFAILQLVLTYHDTNRDWVTLGGIHTLVGIITDITIGSLLKEPALHCLLAALQTNVALDTFITNNGSLHYPAPSPFFLPSLSYPIS